MLPKTKTLWIAGETGLVGRALTREFSKDYKILSAPHSQLDLTRQVDVQTWLKEHKPAVILMAAGKVGGISANQNDQAGFLYQNMAMAQNIIHGAYRVGIRRLIYFGSSCQYPKKASQPFREESLLSGSFEPTNEGYALAKMTGIRLCQYYSAQYGVHYRSVIPCNLYGPHDHFHTETSHVIPALIQKFHQAKIKGAESVTVWGTGQPLREFLYVDDLAQAVRFVLESGFHNQPINIGSGVEISIADLAMMMKDMVGFKGDIIFDKSKPDGMPGKIMNNGRIGALGWKAGISLREGLQKTYQFYLNSQRSFAT